MELVKSLNRLQMSVWYSLLSNQMSVWYGFVIQSNVSMILFVHKEVQLYKKFQSTSLLSGVNITLINESKHLPPDLDGTYLFDGLCWMNAVINDSPPQWSQYIYLHNLIENMKQIAHKNRTS